MLVLSSVLAEEVHAHISAATVVLQESVRGPTSRYSHIDLTSATLRYFGLIDELSLLSVHFHGILD